VPSTLTEPPAKPVVTAWERFEALYRSSRDDVYAYVATLLRDPSAAEDVSLIALAVMVPAGLLGAFGWWTFTAVRRRRREQALDLA
jgi:hypothetical protein